MRNVKRIQVDEMSCVIVVIMNNWNVMTGREREKSHYKKHKINKNQPRKLKSKPGCHRNPAMERHKLNKLHYVIKWQNKNSSPISNPRITLLCIREAQRWQTCWRAAGHSTQFRLSPRECSHPSFGQIPFFFPQGLENVFSETQTGVIRTEKANVTSA